MNNQLLKVGLGSCGIAAGAQDVYNYLSSDIDKNNYPGLDLGKTSCIGLCFAEPIVEFHEGDKRIVYGNVDIKLAEKILKGISTGVLPEENRILEEKGEGKRVAADDNIVK